MTDDLPNSLSAPLGIPARVWQAIRGHQAVIAVEPLECEPADTVIVCATPEPHISALAAGDVVIDGGISDAAPAVFVRFRPARADGGELSLDLDLSNPQSRAGVWEIARQELVVISFVDSLRVQVVEQRALMLDEWRDDLEGVLRAADAYFN